MGVWGGEGAYSRCYMHLNFSEEEVDRGDVCVCFKNVVSGTTGATCDMAGNAALY